MYGQVFEGMASTKKMAMHYAAEQALTKVFGYSMNTDRQLLQIESC